MVAAEGQIARAWLKARTASEEQLLLRSPVLQVGQMVCKVVVAAEGLGRENEDTGNEENQKEGNGNIHTGFMRSRTCEP